MRMSTGAVLLGLLLCSAPAVAQEQRASLEGVAKDNSGAVLPGVTVEAKNLAQGNVSTAVTDDQGTFRFPALPPGAYQVSASLASFAPAKFDRVDLALGEIKRIELTLGVSGVAENVQVTAEQPLIDVKQNQRSYNITASQFERLPRGRDFATIVTQAPGANQEARSGGISIDGSSASENRFIIDGVETTNPETGVQGKRMVLDFIGEMQIKSSGYTAEYGGSTGGVINIITRSGSNNYRGNAGLYFTSDALEGDPRRTLRLSPTDTKIAEYIRYPEDKNPRLEPGVGLGGPILRDRLWFFASYFPSLESEERTAPLSNNTPITREQKTRTQNLTANVSAQVTSKSNGKFAYNSSYESEIGALPAQNGSTSPLAVFDTDTLKPNYSLSGNYDYTVSDRLFLGVRGGYYHQNEFTEGVPTGTRYIFSRTNVGLAGVPAAFQQVTGFTNLLSNNVIDRNKYGRTNVQADATYYLNFGGQHTFKGGLQLDRISNDVLEGSASNEIRLQWGVPLAANLPVGTYGHYQVRSNGAYPDRGFITEGIIGNSNLGLFIQDSWTIKDRLTLNLGLRTENERVPSYTTADGTAEVAIKWGFSEKLAPRLGFALDLMGDGRTKLYGNWGMYYDIFKTELPRGSFGGDKWLEYYYTLDTFDFMSLDVPGCPPACPGQLIRGPVDFRHPSNAPGEQTIDPDIKPMRLQEASLGLEREIGRGMAVSARYVHKQIDRAIEDVGQLDAQGNEIYTIGNPGFGAAANVFLADGTIATPFPKAVRDYDAVEFSFNKRYADRWQLRTSYTLSKLYGNYSGLSQSDENGRTSPNVGRNFDYPLMAFDGSGQPVYGRLGTDRPHQFKINAAYDLPGGTILGANYFAASGVPISREAAGITGSRFPIQYAGRLTDGRTPVLSQTDFFVKHEFRLGNTKSFEVNMTITNLFDQDTAINAWPSQLQSPYVVDFHEEDFYAGRVNFPQELTRVQTDPQAADPRFLMPGSTTAALGFQAPRLIRFGAMFRF
jgi:hypothetical protein